MKIVNSDSPGISRDELNYLTYFVIGQSINWNEEERTLAIFGDLVDAIVLDHVYEMSYVTITKFNQCRLLKTSNRTKIIPKPNTIVLQPNPSETTNK